MTLKRQIKRINQRGNAIIEFALSWTLLSLLFMGSYQFGYSFYIYNQLMSCAAGAGDLASRLDYDTGDPSSFTTKIQNMVLYGDTTAGTTTLVPNLTASNVSVSVTTVSSIPTDVTISITNFSINAIFRTFTFSDKPRVTVAYVGHIVCASC